MAKRLTGGLIGSRLTIAITAVVVTMVVVAGGLAGALPGERTVTSDDMATGSVGSRAIANGSIKSKDIKNGHVKTKDIKDGAVAEDKIDEDAVTETKLEDEAVTGSKLGSGAVTTSKLADGAVTSSKMSPSTLASLEPVYARVEGNGTGTPTLTSGTSNTTVSRIGTGQYLVTFDTGGIVGCGWIATRHDNDAGSISSGEIGVERNSTGDTNTLRVRNWDSAGNLEDLSTDGFTVMVLC